MNDRSSRPHRSPHPACPANRAPDPEVRVTRRWGPARIAYHLGLNPSTVHKVLPATAAPAEVDRPGHRDTDQDLQPNNAATSTPRPATWSTSTSRSWAGSPTAAAGGSDGRSRRSAIADRAAHAGARLTRLRLPAPRGRRPLPAGLLRDPSPTRRRRPPRVLATRRRPSSPPAASPSRPCSPTTARLPLPTLGRPSATRSSTAGPAPTGPRPTARSSGSTAPCSRNGPTPTTYLCEADRAAAYPAWLHHYNHHRGHTASKASHRSTACPTSPVRTARSRNRTVAPAPSQGC